MREIKFRGKRIDNGEWVYGGITSPMHEKENLVKIVSIENYEDDEDENIFIEVDIESVDQFTGLKDKNGVEIYEGDIVEFTRAQCRGVSRGTQMFVSYQTYRFCGFGFDETMALTKRRAKECFVVGNIYDNPKLIEII